MSATTEPQNAASHSVVVLARSAWRRLSSALTACLRRVTESSYLLGIATLSSGQIVAAVIPFLAAPILGRIYLPEDYAVLGIYMAISSVVSVFATFQYQNGTIAERSERSARGITALVIVTSALSSLILLGIVAALSAAVDLEAYTFIPAPWLLILPLLIFAQGIVTVASCLANRYKRYALMAATQLVSSLSSVIISLFLGLLGLGSDALLSACVISQLVSLIMYTGFMRGSGLRRSDFRLSRLLIVARRYRNYAIYLLPTSLIDIGQTRLPIFLLTAQAAPLLLGAYTRASSIVLMPTLLLGGAVSKAYFQRAAEDYRRLGHCWDIYKKTACGLAAAGVLPTIALVLFGPQMFEFYLGSNWTVAGEVAQVLAPMLFIRLWVQPLNSVALFSGNQWLALWTCVPALVLVGGFCTLPILYGLEPIYIIYGYVLGNCVLYMVQFSISFHLSRPSKAKWQLRKRPDNCQEATCPKHSRLKPSLGQTAHRKSV